ncbi:MAG: DUF362 domain-containing protein [Candidatus Helarchaeota archaeon]
MREKVYLIPQTTYEIAEIKEKILAFLEQEHFEVDAKVIYLKPSFVFPSTEKIQVITNPNLVIAVAEALADLGAAKIFIGDGETLGPARFSFKQVRIKKLIKKRGLNKRVKPYYNDEGKKIRIKIPNPYIKEEFIIPKKVIDADVFISLPKLKVNIFANVTLSVKNHMGLISKDQRLSHHDRNMHKMIADLYLVRTPDLNITDAIIAGEGQGPMEADPVETGLIVAGRNGLAVDTVCCALMNYDPTKIEHLRLLHEKGVGPITLEDIDLVNAPLLEEHRKTFKVPDTDITNLAPNLHVYLGKECVNCTVKCAGCLGMIKANLDGYGLNLGWENLDDISILVGRGVELSETELATLNKKRTIIYGDCVKDYRKNGVFFKGCPPDYVGALLKLRKPMGGLTPWMKYITNFSSIWNYGTAKIEHAFAKLFHR